MGAGPSRRSRDVLLAQIFETGRFLTDKGEQIKLDDAIETANYSRF